MIAVYLNGGELSVLASCSLGDWMVLATTSRDAFMVAKEGASMVALAGECKLLAWG